MDVSKIKFNEQFPEYSYENLEHMCYGKSFCEVSYTYYIDRKTKQIFTKEYESSFRDDVMDHCKWFKKSLDEVAHDINNDVILKYFPDFNIKKKMIIIKEKELKQAVMREQDLNRTIDNLNKVLKSTKAKRSEILTKQLELRNELDNIKNES